MWYALVMVCAVGKKCDLDHAAWARQSAPIYDTIEECQDDAVYYAVRSADEMRLDKGVRYRIWVDCQRAQVPI